MLLNMKNSGSLAYAASRCKLAWMLACSRHMGAGYIDFGSTRPSCHVVTWAC